MRILADIIEAIGKPVIFILVVAALIIGVGVHRLAKRMNTNDAGVYCPNGLTWKMPDEGACYRECAIAATSSEHPDYNTEKCARNACAGYTKVCRP